MLVVAAALYLVELVADKIPYFDSLWDAVSTAIRPTVGAVIGLLIAQDAPTLEQASWPRPAARPRWCRTWSRAVCG